MVFLEKVDWKTQKTRETIGIWGTESGCGATHLAIALASYVAGRQRMHTTVAECNTSQAFAKLEQVYERLPEISENREFWIRRICYKKQVSIEEIRQMQASGQECLILDFGKTVQTQWECFLSCKICIVVLSLREWKLPSFERFMEETREHKERKSWCFVVRDGFREDIREMEKRYQIYLKQMPCEMDPFQIRRENIKFYESLLQTGRR